MKEYTFTPEYTIKQGVPFDGSSYYPSPEKEFAGAAEARLELAVIESLDVYEVQELYLNGVLIQAFTPSIDVEKALISRLACGFYGTKYAEFKILGTHKDVLLRCPNL